MTRSLLAVMFALAFFQTLQARAGEISLGVSFGFVNNDLTDLDDLIVSANADGATGPITTKQLGNGYEVAAILGYRFDGTVWAVHLQPSYYFNSEDGTGDTGTFEYGVTALVAMPMLRVYALENDFLSLFFQFGVGWAQMYGKINEGPDQTEFSGSNLGYQGGVGLAMCYAKMHCLNVEANLRFLEVERSIVDETTSGGTHATGRVTQAVQGQELEVDGRDLGIDLSGLQFLAGYVFRF